MDWKQTKTIFILTFLVLNVFLGYQLYLKMDKNNLKTLAEQPLEQRLADNNINYADKIPAYDEEQTFISGQRYSFTEAEKNSFTFKGISLDQSSSDLTLFYKLAKPYKLPANNPGNAVNVLTDFMQKDIIRGKEYVFYKWDPNNHAVWFAQEYLNKPIFYDINNFAKRNPSTGDFDAPNGMVKFDLDKKGNMVSYTQTYLVIMRQGAFQEIISPKKALGRLFDTGHLYKGDTVKSMGLGYFSLASVGDLQVYAPTWSIQTEKAHFLVNATDSSIQVLNGNE